METIEKKARFLIFVKKQKFSKFMRFRELSTISYKVNE